MNAMTRPVALPEMRVSSTSLVTIVTLGLFATCAVAQQPPNYSNVEEPVRNAILDLLNRIGLDHEALVALNLSAAQAESIVGQARSWYETHGANWTAAVASHAVARNDWMDARLAKDRGEEVDIESAMSNLANADAQLATLLQSVRSSIEVHLSSSQLTLWTLLQTNSGTPMPFRILSLSVDQQRDIRSHRQLFLSSVAVAADDNAHVQAESNWNSALSTILSDDEESMVAAYTGYRDASGANVKNAIDLVLPLAN